MTQEPSHSGLRLNDALLAVTLGAALVLMVTGNAFPLFLAAVALVAWYGGPRLGLVVAATILGFGLTQAFLASPEGGGPPARDFVTFGTVALLIIGLAGTSRQFGGRVQPPSEMKSRGEGHYRLLFERNPHPMWVYDTETLRFLAVNRAAVETYGYSPEEFLSMTIADVRPKEDVPSLLKRVAEVRDKTSLNAGGWRHRKKDGSIIDVEISSDAIDFEGRPARLVLALDITARRQAEKQRDLSLRRERAAHAVAETSERRYRLLARAIPQVVWVARSDGSIDYFNRRWSELTGQNRDQSSGRGWQDALHPDDRPRWLARWDQATAQAEPFSLDVRVRRLDGAYRWHLARSLPLRNRSGRVTKWLGTFTDIDAQKWAEGAQAYLSQAGAELAASLDVEATLTRVAGLAVPAIADLCTVDMVAEPGGAIRQVAVSHVEPRLEQWLWNLRQRDPIDPDGSHPVARVLRTSRTDFAPDLPDGLLPDAASSSEDREVFRNLGLRSYICTPLVARGRTLGAITFLMAGSGRRYGPADLPLAEELARRAALGVDNAMLYREAQQARAEAEAASGAKDRFLAMVSHELRTPLTPVLAGVSTLLDEFEVPPPAREVLETIQRNVDVELRLIDDLLDLTRLGSGKLRLQRETVDAHELIARAVDVCQPDLHVASVQLDLALTASEHWVYADPLRFQQVIWNLLKNATKFTPAGGAITVATRNGEVDPDGLTRPTLIVDVRDTGIGIAQDLLTKVFEAFEQGDSLESRRRVGLGLGLTISRSIIEAHDGRLTAHSAGPGHGSTFTAELATVPARLGVPKGATPSGGFALRPMKILLVEDNQDTLRFLSWALTQHGHSVVAADRLSSALDAARAGDVDLVISDMELPDGSGLDLMRELRLEKSVPAIALSGYGSDEDVELSRRSGFAQHLTKPVDVRALEEAIRAVSETNGTGT